MIQYVSPPRRIVLNNELSEVGKIRDFLLPICRDCHLDEDTIKRRNLAVEEWIVNIVSYAYPHGTSGTAEITAQIGNDGVLTVVISDRGVAFDPTKVGKVDTEADIDQRTVGGLGIHLIRTIMDTMAYERTDDGRNVLTLTKQL